jgi:hypothetical protein
MNQYPEPPFAKQTQPPPGMTSQLDPVPDHGEQSYKGSLATAYVMLADSLSSYVSGATIAVTGGKPII